MHQDRSMTRSGDWIPRDSLIAANAFNGASWFVLFALALAGTDPGSLPSLAWVHLVALGWLSLASLSVLVHVIPAFTGVHWRYEALARWAIRGFGLGVVVLVSGFAFTNLRVLEWGSVVVFAAILIYFLVVLITLVAQRRMEEPQRVVARALIAVLATFVVVAALGALFGGALNGRVPGAVLIMLPGVHAMLGIAAWLTLLVFGVSSRTVRAISGSRPRSPALHSTSSAFVFFGAIALAIAWMMSSQAFALVAASVLGSGALLYGLALLDAIRRRESPNLVPQSYLFAAGLWLLVSVVLGIGAVVGRPWGAAFVYVALAGWLGQMVNGHVFHIGIRLMITTIRGDDDETRPWVVVDVPLALASFVLFQLAIALGSIGLLRVDHSLVILAAAFGIGGWLAMGGAVLGAYRRVLTLHAA